MTLRELLPILYNTNLIEIVSADYCRLFYGTVYEMQIQELLDTEVLSCNTFLAEVDKDTYVAALQIVLAIKSVQ